MELENKIKTINKSINVVYYTIYLLTIIAVVTIFFLSYSNVGVGQLDPFSPWGIRISSVYMILLLLSIPATFYWFYKKTLKLKEEKNESLRLTPYKKAAYIRLWVMGILLVIGVVLVYVLRSQSMIFMAAIAAIALYFCKPTAAKLIQELDLDVDINKFGGRR